MATLYGPTSQDISREHAAGIAARGNEDRAGNAGMNVEAFRALLLATSDWDWRSNSPRITETPWPSWITLEGDYPVALTSIPQYRELLDCLVRWEDMDLFSHTQWVDLEKVLDTPIGSNMIASIWIDQQMIERLSVYNQRQYCILNLSRMGDLARTCRRQLGSLSPIPDNMPTLLIALTSLIPLLEIQLAELNDPTTIWHINQ